MSAHIAKDVLKHGLSQLDLKALEQIALHCESTTKLAIGWAKQDGLTEAMRFIKDVPEYDDMKQLAAYCRRIIEAADNVEEYNSVDNNHYHVE